MGRAKQEKGRCDIDSNELVFTFGGSYVCDNFCENRSRNATMRVPTDGHKPIAMGQIISTL